MIASPPKLVVTRAIARAAWPSLLTSTRQDIGGSHVERKVVVRCNVDFEDLGVAPAEAPQFMTYGAGGVFVAENLPPRVISRPPAVAARIPAGNPPDRSGLKCDAIGHRAPLSPSRLQNGDRVHTLRTMARPKSSASNRSGPKKDTRVGHLVLAGTGSVREVRMFGGLCFMLNGNMVAGASKRGLLVRVGKDQHTRALARPDAKRMEMPGRPMEGYVFIDPLPRDEQTLREWLDLAVAFVNTLPAKSPRLRSRRVKAK
jgi:TfoX/Sxy family transcriptional regulator of competence genes